MDIISLSSETWPLANKTWARLIKTSVATIRAQAMKLTTLSLPIKIGPPTAVEKPTWKSIWTQIWTPIQQIHKTHQVRELSQKVKKPASNSEITVSKRNEKYTMLTASRLSCNKSQLTIISTAAQVSPKSLPCLYSITISLAAVEGPGKTLCPIKLKISWPMPNVASKTKILSQTCKLKSPKLALS